MFDLQVGQLVAAIKMGWIKLDQEKKKKDDKPRYYDLWNNEEVSDYKKLFFCQWLDGGCICVPIPVSY
jgi:hypothetical protein